MTGIEIAAIGTAISTAAPYVAAGSAVLGAASSLSSGQQQAAAGRYNAALAERSATIAEGNAFAAERDANAEAARLSDQNRRRLASVTAAQGAAGADIASGSPLEVLADQLIEFRLDEEIVRWQGRLAGRGYREQASGLRSQAALDRAGARQAQRAGYVTAATTLLGGLGRAASMFPASGGSGVSSTPASRVGSTGRLAGPV